MKTSLRTIALFCCCLFLTQCVAPAMLLAPQSQLMWALLKPMVGLDPKEANLFKQPLIQSRLEPLLGSHYAGAVQLLETADKIQQEGPLFYVVSKYTPVPELAEKAGFVWNSETNQMAVLLVSGGAPQIFAEKLNNEIAQQVPAWPAELSDYTDPVKLKQQALEQAKQQVSEAVPVPAAIAPVAEKVEQLKSLKEQGKAQLKQTQQDVVEQVLSPVQDTKNQLQQVKDVKEQAQTTLTQPVDAAQKQLEQMQQQGKSVVEQPVKALEQQNKQQLQQAKDDVQQQIKATATESDSKELKYAVTSATTEQIKLMPTPPDKNTDATIEKSQAHPTDALKQITETKLPQSSTQAAADMVHDKASDSQSEEDLAAELAAEQQSLANSPNAKARRLQQDIAEISRQLTQSKNPAEVLELQHKLQKLQEELNQLTSGQ